LDGWNMIGSIRWEENLWNYEHVTNNLILHLWTRTKLVAIGSKITNPCVTKNMLLKTLEDFNSPSFFESLNLFFRFNKHKHHIMHMQITPTINICYISKYIVTFMGMKNLGNNLIKCIV
jgi:hypothetical protein